MAGENTAEDFSAGLDEARSLSNEKLTGAGQLQSPSQFHVPQNGQADNHVDRLAQARERDGEKKEDGAEQKAEGGAGNVKDLLKNAKNLVENANPIAAVSLLGQIDPSKDMPFVAAAGAALLKDLMVLATFETVILPIVFSVLCSIFIFMMMSLVGANGKRKGAAMLLKKVGVLFGGGVLGSIPGLDIFPFETLTVGIIYYLTLIERKNSH